MSSETINPDSVEQTQTDGEVNSEVTYNFDEFWFVTMLITVSSLAIAFTLWGAKNVAVCAKLTYKLCRYTFGKVQDYITDYFDK